MANKKKQVSQKKEVQKKKVGIRNKKHKCNHLNDDGTKCGESFDRKDNFNRHVRSKHTGYVYTCSKSNCGYWSRSTQRLSEHNSSGHTLTNGDLSLEEKKNILTCDRCGFHFINRIHFENHKANCVSMTNRVWEYLFLCFVFYDGCYVIQKSIKPFESSQKDVITNASPVCTQKGNSISNTQPDTAAIGVHPMIDPMHDRKYAYMSRLVFSQIYFVMK